MLRKLLAALAFTALLSGPALADVPAVGLYQQAISSAQTSAGTVLLVSHLNSTATTYIFSAYEQAQAAQTTATVKYEYGTGTLCGTNTVVLQGTAMATTSTAGDFFGYGTTSNTALAPPQPSVTPVTIVPPGNDFCVVLVGSAINAIFYTIYIQQTQQQAPN
jgi:hypothetical protein